jgi:putative heme degradation protein
MNHTIATPYRVDFLANPAALRQAWADLLAQNHHLHGPEVAARLGVPEAAMLAARIGHGAVALVPDLAALLAPCGQWGKVLLAARNRLGVALMIMDDPAVQVHDTHVHLQTARHLGVVSTVGIDRCYLFEEHDHHGHTLSLNWFDGRGDVIGRLFLMSKSGREVALPVLHALALPNQNPHWQPGEAMPSAVVLPDAPAASAVETDVWATGAATPAAAEQVVMACAAATDMTVVLQGAGVAVRYSGPLAKTMRTPGAVHAADSACKLHLRMDAATQLALAPASASDGAPTLWVQDGQGGSMAFAAGPWQAASQAWLATLAQKIKPKMALPLV